MKAYAVQHQFVKSIPTSMAEGILYVSVEFATVGHKCCCGCGNEVFTRLSPKDWQLTYDGRSISLNPSIGNWNFPCQSHYWIKNNRVVWDKKWSKAKIAALKLQESEDGSGDESDRSASRIRRKNVWKRLFGGRSKVDE